jgi:pyridoxine/pyridoxamine 5'-phosphate oxidase
MVLVELEKLKNASDQFFWEYTKSQASIQGGIETNKRFKFKKY